MSFLTKILGDPNKRVIEKLQPIVQKINSLESKFESFSNDKIKEKTQQFRERLKKGETLDDLLPEAFAMVREASKRTLGQRHFDVQLIGGMVLHRGQITEMKTGEGKTLVATLPLYLNALSGKGCHLVTPNDYLSRHGAGWMGPIYHLLGVSVGVISHETAFLYDPEFENQTFMDEYAKHFRPVLRKEAYSADITYGTNNEFGFDYIRDNMVSSLEHMVQRELNYAIVDEVDSILIDEARTPLIISAPKEEATEKYYEFAHLVKRLKENEDYNVDEKMRAATLTEGGIQKMEKWLGIDNIYEAGGVETVHHIEQALKSYTLFKRDRDYVVKEGEIIIVDEFTGRLMFGRRYSEGLHQAIEAKEGMQIQRESETLATITFQNYFRLYKKLAGMTGTAATEAEEFAKIYNLEVLVIPTNEPMIRCDFQDRIYRNEKGKFKAIVEEIKARHKKGQPVLVGTVSIEKNELLGEMLAREGIPLEILNAKHHEKEAQIIAQTGRIGAVTVATNMAGRGVDIILGGDPPDREEQKKVISLGGLHVIGTERHEARRIDNQLRGRSGRQGDPGSSQFYISMEDDLMRIFGSERMKGLMAKLGVPEDMPIENKLISRSIEAAQKKVEGYNFDVRKNLVEYDDVINKHRETIYKKRKEILEASIRRKEKLKETVLEMVTNEIEQVVSFHTATKNERDWNIEEVYEVVNSIFSVPSEVRIKLDDIQEEAGIDVQDVKARTKIIKYLIKLARKYYDEIEKGINESAKEIVGTEEPHLMREIEKGILIRAIDTLWIEHLNAMDALRTGIGLRGYGQRDPLIEYKKEAYRLFVELMNLIQKQVTYSIYKVGLARKLAPSLIERRGVVMSAPAKIMEKGKGQFSGVSLPKEEKEKVVKGDNVPVKPRDMMGRKIGRNDPCPCGSGKKYKKCCGR